MIGCSRTAEVQELLRLGHWPQAGGADLAAHVPGCRKCRELVLVSQALIVVKASSMSEAHVEPPALVWWRAQLRRKNEAVQRMERPIRAQMLVVLAVVCVGLGLAFRLSGGANAWRSWMSAGAGSLGLGVIIASGVALAMMAGLAVYLTVERK